MSLVKFITATPKAEHHIAYTARVSNPTNQLNEASEPKLLKYLIEHKHWSPFEQSYMTLEINTSRGIAPQILRHRSFSFQEFSQRYAEAVECVIYPARRQDSKNRQNSLDDMGEGEKAWFARTQLENWQRGLQAYKAALELGIAKEQARFLLPLGTATKLYMSGTARSWIHYIQLRSGPETQLEHRQIAIEAKECFGIVFPNTAAAMGWTEWDGQ